MPRGCSPGCSPAPASFPTLQWRAVASSKAQQRATLEACLLKLVNRQLLQAWHSWAAHVQRRRAKALAAAHYERRLLAASLAAFQRPLALKPLAEACLRRLLNRQLGAAWAAWREHMAASREAANCAAARGRAAVMRMQNRLLAEAWASWREYAERNRRLRQVLRRIQQRAALAALLCWRERTQRMQSARRLMLRSLAGTQQWAFGAWRDAAADAAAERCALERAAAAEGSGRTTPKKLLFALRGEPHLALLMETFEVGS